MGVAKFPARPNFGRSSFLQMSKSPKTLLLAEFLPSIHGGCESAENGGEPSFWPSPMGTVKRAEMALSLSMLNREGVKVLGTPPVEGTGNDIFI